MNIEQIIRRFTTETEQQEGATAHRGSATASEYSAARDFPEPEGMQWREEWSTRHRGVWTSARLLSSVTYCEGDVIVMLYDTPEAFAEDMRTSADFYREHA